MLSEPLDLGKVDVGQLFDYLYAFFHRDFIQNKTLLAQSILVDPQSQLKEDGKECTFWHLTSRENMKSVKNKDTGRYEQVKVRLPDYARSSRIEWVKQIIVNHDHDDVLCFYHKETQGKKQIRYYLWADQDDFVVILQKLGRSSSFLVTSFYIDYEGKRVEFQRRYEHYKSGNAKELMGCEWF
ncbi:MAG TPA: hypothetical protein PLU46_03795 [Thiotrichales bacterium]|nr:MAG: hypothetical protein B7X85_00045 [Thiotrichales bacterium 17-46-47]HQT01967.1 hypothetical protein [Thiotrichales bacterium]HQT04091.1 hypothetical protein [Thiotrichales bacterium]